jgi:hypothetical protein
LFSATAARPGRGLLVSGAITLGAAALVAASGGGAGAAPTATQPSYRSQLAAQPLLQGQTRPHDVVQKAPLDATIYAADSSKNMYAAVRAAATIPFAPGSRNWKEAGPFGVDFIPGIANGGEKLSRVAGIVTSVAVDPTNANVVYYGTHGGLYVSRDAGKHFTNLSDGRLPRVPVGAIAIDPAHPKDIYVGTGVAYYTISNDAPGIGVWVSHDGGQSFRRPAANVTAYGVHAITVTANTILVGTNAGLYRSVNRGASFVRVFLPTSANHVGQAEDPFGNWVQSIVVRPDNPNLVTIDVGWGGGKYTDKNGVFLGPDHKPVAPGNGLYRSTNRGLSFTYFPTPDIANGQDATNDPYGRISLAYGTAPGQAKTLWALVSDAGRFNGHSAAEIPDSPDPLALGIDPFKDSELGGLYRSTDDGATWTLQATSKSLLLSVNSTQAPLEALDYGPGVQASYNSWVATDPIDPNRIYFGLEEAFEGEYGAANPSGVPLPVNADNLTKFQVIQRYADMCGFFTATAAGLVSLVTGTGGPPATGCPDQVPLYGGMSTHPDQHAAVVVKTGPNALRMYSGNDGGFFVQDAGLEIDSALATGNVLGFGQGNWRNANTVATLLPYHANFWSKGRLIVALQDNGAAYVEPGGKGVEICGGDSMEVLPGPTDDSMFCTHGNDSTDFVTGNGQGLYDISPFPHEPFGLAPLVQDPLNRTHLLAAGRNVLELTDMTFRTLDILQSVHWTSLFDAGVSPAPAFAGSSCPKALSPTHCSWQASSAALYGPTAYVAICGVCRATLGNTARINAAVVTNLKAGCKPEYGKSACWHRTKSKGLPKRRIGGIAFDPTNPKTVYVGLQDLSMIGYNRAVNGTQRVMVSHDGGESFTDLSGNLPLANVWGMIIRDHKPIIATEVGIFTAEPNSNTWMRLGKGLPGIRAQDVRSDPTGRYLVAPMYGRSAWTYDFGKRATSGTNVVPPTNPGKLATTGTGPTLAAVGFLLVLAGLIVRRRRPVG